MQTGVYKYFLNGKPAGIQENFAVRLLPDNSVQTVSTRDAKPFDTMVRVETREKDDKFQTCRITYQNRHRTIKAEYEFSGNSLRVLRKINRKVVSDEISELPQNSIFFPLMRRFQGNTILQVAENQGFTTVVIPDIESTTKFSNLLKPTFDERTARLIKRENDRSIYSYTSKHYDDNSQFHLDEKGFLLYYKFVPNRSQTWEVKL